MNKRLFPLLLALMLCLGLTVPALATNSDFTIENGVLKQYNGSGGSVTIPNGVTAIGDYAIERCITSANKDRKAPGGGRSWTRAADDAAICA